MPIKECYNLFATLRQRDAIQEMNYIKKSTVRCLRSCSYQWRKETFLPLREEVSIDFGLHSSHWSNLMRFLNFDIQGHYFDCFKCKKITVGVMERHCNRSVHLGNQITAIIFHSIRERHCNRSAYIVTILVFHPISVPQPIQSLDGVGIQRVSCCNPTIQ